MDILLAFLGFVLYIVLGMIKTKQKHSDKKFSPVQYLKDEMLTLVASAVSVIILIVILPEISLLLSPNYAGYSGLISAIIGFSGYTIFDKIVQMILPKKFQEK